jgi:hypothetical protein
VYTLRGGFESECEKRVQMGYGELGDVDQGGFTIAITSVLVEVCVY